MLWWGVLVLGSIDTLLLVLLPAVVDVPSRFTVVGSAVMFGIALLGALLGCVHGRLAHALKSGAGDLVNLALAASALPVPAILFVLALVLHREGQCGPLVFPLGCTQLIACTGISSWALRVRSTRLHRLSLWLWVWPVSVFFAARMLNLVLDPSPNVALSAVLLAVPGLLGWTLLACSRALS